MTYCLPTLDQFGWVPGNPTQDCLPYFQNALASTCDTVYLPAGALYGVSGSIPNNRCMSIVGLGNPDSTVIYPLPGFSSGCDILTFTPPAGEYSFLRLENFLINPGQSGAVLGNNCISMNFAAQGINLAHLHMEHVYCFTSNGMSLVSSNSAANFQGCVSLSTIERCQFYNGVQLNGVGDAVRIKDSVVRADANTTGIEVTVLNTSVGGAGSSLEVTGNDIVAGHGAIKVNSRCAKIRDNVIEHSAGTGSNSAVIDLDGAIGMSEITGNSVTIYGASTAYAAIRVNTTDMCMVDRNTLLSGINTAYAVYLTAGAKNPCININGASGFANHLFTDPASSGLFGSQVWRVTS